MKSELTIDEDGTKVWDLPNGLRHRQDGPAIEWEDGDKHWFLDNIHYTEINYKHEIRSRKLKQLFN
jgi:hypothetical protein